MRNDYTEVDISIRFTATFWDDGDIEITDHYRFGSEAPLLMNSDEFYKLTEEYRKFNEK